MTAGTESRAAMSAAAIDDLPDSDFAYIEDGGTKDAEGKTTPRSKRHFPIHDAAHVRNALARLSSSPFGDKARAAVMAAARKFGIDTSESKSADRPSFELLKRRRGSMSGIFERRALPFTRGQVELRAKPSGHGTTNYEFNGYAVAYLQPFQMWDKWGDEYDENVEQRACAPSVARPDLDTPFLIGHNDAGISLARTRSGTMRLFDDSFGLGVNVPDMDGRSPLVQSLASAIDRGDMDEMSVGFICRRQKWSDDYMTRNIQEMDIHRGDVSIVALAANPATKGASMIALPTESLSRQAAEQRAQDETVDTSRAPDFNVAADDPAANGSPATKCPYTRTNGCGQMCPGSARFCPSCGGPLYDGDGALVVDDSGVVEESKGDADLLSRRLRLLELA